MKLKILIAILSFMMLSFSQSFAQKRHGGGRNRGGNSTKAVGSHRKKPHPPKKTVKDPVKQPINKKKKD